MFLSTFLPSISKWTETADFPLLERKQNLKDPNQTKNYSSLVLFWFQKSVYLKFYVCPLPTFSF